QTAVAVPVASTCEASAWTGPTLTPHTLATTLAATPTSTSRATLTLPTLTLTRPSCVVVAAAAGPAAAPASSAEAETAASILFVRDMELPLVWWCGSKAGRRCNGAGPASHAAVVAATAWSPPASSTHRRAARTALPGLARPAVSRVQQRTHRMTGHRVLIEHNSRCVAPCDSYPQQRRLPGTRGCRGCQRDNAACSTRRAIGAAAAPPAPAPTSITPTA